MSQKVLVLSTVHHSDDTRIRERLVRTLAKSFDVVYATRAPAPSARGDHVWTELRGSRLARIARTVRILATTDADVVSLHDPELILCGWVASLRGLPVVFDLHERLPDQLAEKPWMPLLMRRMARLAARLSLRFADAVYDVTLAEGEYSDLFKHRLPVFPNYPFVEHWPVRRPANGTAIYVGGVTRQRGLHVAVEAAGIAGVPLVVVGPFDEGFGSELVELALRSGTELELTGRLPNDEALDMIAEASVALSPLLAVGNYRRSLPTKIIEYASVGVPTVASDLPGTKEVAEVLDGVVLVEPGSVKALAVGLTEAMLLKAQEAASAGAEAARESFVWPATAVTDFYQGLVG